MSDDDASSGDWLVLYGSLMRGLGGMERVGVGSGLRYAGPCVVRGELFDLGPYPGLRAGEARVVGELYAILDASIMRVLDEFEGYAPGRPRDSLYLRERTPLVEPERTEAWIYRYNRVPDAAARVATGDWRAHLAEREA